MRNGLLVLAMGGGLAAAMGAAGSGMRDAAAAPAAPAFTHDASADWLNSPPLQWPALSGRVVLVEFWTFDCGNCRRTSPWLNALYERHRAAGLEIVGVHTPEFPHEKVATNVRREAQTLGIRYPVMLDNDYSTWNAWRNEYWPALYLVDARGRVRASYAGETHEGDAQARRIEANVLALLKERGG